MYTLLEQAKNISPKGMQMKIAETMTKAINLLGYLPWYPSNDIWAHKTSIEATASITLNWRGINEYTGGTDVLSDEQWDIIAMLDETSDFDKVWIDRQPDPAMARLQKAKHKLKLMAQGLCSSFLYDNNRINPKRPHGLAPRVNALGRYCLDAGGSSNLTSIYVLTLGDDGVYGVYPSTGKAPETEFLVDHQNKGERYKTNSAGKELLVYTDHFHFEGGLVVADPRTLGRVANIDSTTAAASAFENQLIILKDRMEITDKTIILMNETLLSACRIRQKGLNNVTNWDVGKGEGLFGVDVTKFDGIPIVKIDSRILLNSEGAVS